MTIKRKRRS